MSQQFYQKFLSLFFGFSFIMILFVVAAELLLFYVTNQNQIFYYAYLGILLFIFYYGIRFYQSFTDFQQNFDLFLSPSQPNNEKQLEPLDVDVEDRALKVCLYYRNGASFTDIDKTMEFQHPNQARRELIKGLDFLLKFYDEHRTDKP